MSGGSKSTSRHHRDGPPQLHEQLAQAQSLLAVVSDELVALRKQPAALQEHTPTATATTLPVRLERLVVPSTRFEVSLSRLQSCLALMASTLKQAHSAQQSQPQGDLDKLVPWIVANVARLSQSPVAAGGETQSSARDADADHLLLLGPVVKSGRVVVAAAATATIPELSSSSSSPPPPPPPKSIRSVRLDIVSSLLSILANALLDDNHRLHLASTPHALATIAALLSLPHFATRLDIVNRAARALANFFLASASGTTNDRRASSAAAAAATVYDVQSHFAAASSISRAAVAVLVSDDALSDEPTLVSAARLLTLLLRMGMQSGRSQPFAIYDQSLLQRAVDLLGRPPTASSSLHATLAEFVFLLAYSSAPATPTSPPAHVDRALLSSGLLPPTHQHSQPGWSRWRRDFAALFVSVGGAGALMALVEHWVGKVLARVLAPPPQSERDSTQSSSSSKSLQFALNTLQLVFEQAGNDRRLLDGDLGKRFLALVGSVLSATNTSPPSAAPQTLATLSALLRCVLLLSACAAHRAVIKADANFTALFAALNVCQQPQLPATLAHTASQVILLTLALYLYDRTILSLIATHPRVLPCLKEMLQRGAGCSGEPEPSSSLQLTLEAILCILVHAAALDSHADAVVAGANPDITPCLMQLFWTYASASLMSRLPTHASIPWPSIRTCVCFLIKMRIQGLANYDSAAQSFQTTPLVVFVELLSLSAATHECQHCARLVSQPAAAEEAAAALCHAPLGSRFSSSSNALLPASMSTAPEGATHDKASDDDNAPAPVSIAADPGESTPGGANKCASFSSGRVDEPESTAPASVLSSQPSQASQAAKGPAVNVESPWHFAQFATSYSALSQAVTGLLSTVRVASIMSSSVSRLVGARFSTANPENDARLSARFSESPLETINTALCLPHIPISSSDSLKACLRDGSGLVLPAAVALLQSDAWSRVLQVPTWAALLPNTRSSGMSVEAAVRVCLLSCFQKMIAGVLKAHPLSAHPFVAPVPADLVTPLALLEFEPQLDAAFGFLSSLAAFADEQTSWPEQRRDSSGFLPQCMERPALSAGLIVVAVQERTLTVPKAVLVHESTFFSAMLGSDFREAQSRHIHMKEVTYAGVEFMVEFMCFLYLRETGCASGQSPHPPQPKSMEQILEGMSCADRFLLPKLKLYCLYWAFSRITHETALLVYNYASYFSVLPLKLFAKRFIFEHLVSVAAHACKSSGFGDPLPIASLVHGGRAATLALPICSWTPTEQLSVWISEVLSDMAGLQASERK